MVQTELQGETYTPDTIEAAPPGSVKLAGLTLTEGQGKAVEASRVLMRKPGAGLLAIVGYAGVGKTTLIKVLGQLFSNPQILTPTGKASLRVTEATGYPAKTIHRWLYKMQVNPSTARLEATKQTPQELQIPPSKLLIIDEASMVGPDIWHDLWRTCQVHGLKLILVGDGFQLPPVLPPTAPEFSVFAPKFIEALGGTRVELTEVLRQAQDSPIVRAAMNLRLGMEIRALDELPRVRREDLGHVAPAVYGDGGVIIVNSNVVRHRVNAAMRGGWGFTGGPNPGEALLCLRNNYDLDVMNGEQLEFQGWNVPPTGEPEIVEDRQLGTKAPIHFGVANVEGSRAVVGLEMLDGTSEVGGYPMSIAAERWARARGLWLDGARVMPFLEVNYGYAYTAHKAQGSEWPFALVFLEPGVKLSEVKGRRWAYTAITRASKMAAIFAGRI